MPAVPDSYDWLQLTKDILVPLSSTLVGAGVAYFVARQGSRSQQRILERERELGVLERVYHLLQELERYVTSCYDRRNIFFGIDGGKRGVGFLRKEIASTETGLDMWELERLIELNFTEFSDIFSSVRKSLSIFMILLPEAKMDSEGVIKARHSELVVRIREMREMVVKRREAVRCKVV